MFTTLLTRPSSISSTFSKTVLSGALIALSLPASAQVALRHPTPPPKRNALPPSPVPALVTQDIATGGQTPLSIVQALVGTGVTVTNIQFNGAPIAAGTFSGGTGIIGFAQGIMLSSGDVSSVVGAMNSSDSTSTDNLRPADADLDALVGGLTQDASVLEFDFQCPSTNVISFQYVFASEEYDEWVTTQYNDVFAFFLNGQNIALIPGTTTPVAINNVNCGNPWSPPGGQNCALYTTNSCDSLGLTFPCTNLATEMDGLTSVFSATGALVPGVNHIKLAIADRGDGVYDSNVFIRGTSFVCGQAMPAFDPPSPCGQTLSATVGAGFQFEVDTIATNGYPGEAVTLSVTGDPLPLSSGIFIPPLPAGPAPSVTSEFHWTPNAAAVGLRHLQFTSTDQLGQSSTCDVWINVLGSQTQTYCYGDGSGTICPCGNQSGAGNREGCLNSVSNGGKLVAQGTPALANDTVELQGEQMPNGPALYFQGTARVNAGAGMVFGDGLLCVGGALIRIGVKFNVLGKSVYPTGSDPLLSTMGALAPGDTRDYQAWYRDSAAYCTISTFNLTNAVEITWVP